MLVCKVCDIWLWVEWWVARSMCCSTIISHVIDWRLKSHCMPIATISHVGINTKNSCPDFIFVASTRTYLFVLKILTFTCLRGSLGPSFAFIAYIGPCQAVSSSFQVHRSHHQVVSKVSCKCQKAMCLHGDDKQWIPPKGVAAIVPRKLSALLEVGRKVKLSGGPVCAHTFLCLIRTLYHTSILSKNSEPKVSNKNVNHAAVTA